MRFEKVLTYGMIVMYDVYFYITSKENTRRIINNWMNMIIKSFVSAASRPLGCFSTVAGKKTLILCLKIFFFRNLRRLVHAMILKSPPGEWMPGLLRLERSNIEWTGVYKVSFFRIINLRILNQELQSSKTDP